MKTPIPTLSQIQEPLTALNHAELQALSENCHVGFGTLMKIRQGTTLNPGIETIRKFMTVLEDQPNRLVKAPA